LCYDRLFRYEQLAFSYYVVHNAYFLFLTKGRHALNLAGRSH